MADMALTLTPRLIQYAHPMDPLDSDRNTDLLPNIYAFILDASSLVTTLELRLSLQKAGVPESTAPPEEQQKHGGFHPLHRSRLTSLDCTLDKGILKVMRYSHGIRQEDEEVCEVLLAKLTNARTELDQSDGGRYLHAIDMIIERMRRWAKGTN